MVKKAEGVLRQRLAPGRGRCQQRSMYLVFHDTLGFAGTVVHANTDVEDVEPARVGTHE